MSNSSDRAPKDLAGRADSGALLLAQMLTGIAEECSCLSLEIAGLGDRLSEIEVGANKLVGAVEMQLFDRLTQNAHAQARLVAHLARVIAGGEECDRATLLGIIVEIPLTEVRQRLKRTIGEEAEEVAENDEEFWGDNTPACEARTGDAP